jgi:riboflavin biosynthesis pyrimidine reductase
MLFTRLQPAGPPVRAADLVAELGDAVALNMVTTLDGRAAIDGTSRPLGGEGDLAMLVALRGWAQALVVGPGTLRAEGYGRIRPDLPVVVVSRSGVLPWGAGLFAAGDQPVVVYTEADVSPPPVAARLEIVRLEQATPETVAGALRARGLRRVLLEGGPTLNRAMLAAGVIDELFLTLTPVLTAGGGEPRIVEGDRLPEPVRAQPRWVLEAGGEIFLRYALT